MAPFLLQSAKPWYCVSPDLVAYVESRANRATGVLARPQFRKNARACWWTDIGVLI
jgi:hypothetical protein